MMDEDAIQQFRITAWPNLRLPHPRVGRWLDYGLSCDDRVFAAVGLDPDWEGPNDEFEAQALREAGEWAPLPQLDEAITTSRPPDEVAAAGEIYLELADLDLDDDHAIARFVTRFGLLGVCYERFAFFRQLPQFQEALIEELLYSWPYRWIATHEGYLLHRGASADAILVETLTEFRFGARVLRDLTQAWQIATGSQGATTADWQSIPADVLAEEKARLADKNIDLTNDTLASEVFLQGLLSAGLRPFHPRLIQADTSPLDDDFIPLYSTCCLELYNHIVENATYRHCANETCRRTFVRQLGRAEHGQHRTQGIKYCSKHCARAQAQRDFRTRQRSRSKNKHTHQQQS